MANHVTSFDKLTQYHPGEFPHNEMKASSYQPPWKRLSLQDGERRISVTHTTWQLSYFTYYSKSFCFLITCCRRPHLCDRPSHQTSASAPTYAALFERAIKLSTFLDIGREKMIRRPRATIRSPRLLGKKISKEEPAVGTLGGGVVVPCVGHFTQCGRRHAANEDRVVHSTLPAAMGMDETEMLSFQDMLSLKPEHINSEDVILAGVFDGHGGVGCVDYVSANLPKRIAEAVSKEKRTFDQLESAVMDGFKICEEDFMRHAMQTFDTSGCCALVALVHQNQLLISWAGDSRAVLYDGKYVEQLSLDHRASNQHEHRRIVENGGAVLNNRLQGVLSPSRSFGDIDVRVNSPEGVLISEPSVTIKLRLDESSIRKQQTFLILASDGVWDAFSNETACEIVLRALKTNGNNAEQAAARLVEDAAKVSSDDLSCVVITWSVVPWDRVSSESGGHDEGEKN